MWNVQEISAAAEQQFAVNKSQNKRKQTTTHYVNKEEDSKPDSCPSLWTALPAISNHVKGNDAIADCTAMKTTQAECLDQLHAGTHPLPKRQATLHQSSILKLHTAVFCPQQNTVYFTGKGCRIKHNWQTCTRYPPTYTQKASNSGFGFN